MNPVTLSILIYVYLILSISCFSWMNVTFMSDRETFAYKLLVFLASFLLGIFVTPIRLFFKWMR